MSYNCWRINMEVKQQTKVKKLIGEGIKFERIRRITGYIVGTVDRFNNVKQAEVADRVKHSKITSC